MLFDTYKSVFTTIKLVNTVPSSSLFDTYKSVFTTISNLNNVLDYMLFDTYKSVFTTILLTPVTTQDGCLIPIKVYSQQYFFLFPPLPPVVWYL